MTWQDLTPAGLTEAEADLRYIQLGATIGLASFANATPLVSAQSTVSTLNVVVGGVQINKALFLSTNVKLQAQGEVTGTAAGVLELYDLDASAIIESLILPNGTFNVSSGVLTLAGALTQYELRLRRNGGAVTDVVSVSWAGLQVA